MKCVLLFVIFLQVFCEVVSFKVLIVYGFPVKSLSILGRELSRHLLDSGHEVTYVTVFPSGNEEERYQEIDISRNLQHFLEIRNETSKISYIFKKKALVFDIEGLQKSAVKMAKLTFLNGNVQKILRDPKQKFDVVVSDYIETEIYAGLAALYQCPMIWSYSLGPNWISTRLVDESTNPAYTSDYLSLNSQPFSFIQRAQELWAQVRWKIVKRFKTSPLEEETYHAIFGPLARIHNIVLPRYNDIIYNASLVLSNDHSALGNIPRLPQNYKLVGGYHIKDPVPALPKNLQILMDNSKNGVIFFSMGSMWKSKDLPNVLRDELLQMFEELNQTVIWKYEEKISYLPENVHIIEWAPQQSILAHPNCRIFITHGGLLSSTEAIHFSVPIIGIPVHYDQFVNINKAVKHGYAIKMGLNLDLAKHLKTSIRAILTDSRYKQKVKDLSRIYHHRPLSPGRDAVHWIEHSVITRGAVHLRNPSLTIPWFQKTYLDLILFTIAVLTMAVIFSIKLLSVYKVKKKIE